MAQVLELIPVAYRWRQDTPLDDWPDHRGALFQQLGFGTLLKGISAAKNKQPPAASLSDHRTKSIVKGFERIVPQRRPHPCWSEQPPGRTGSHTALSHLELPIVVVKFADDTTAVVVSSWKNDETH